MKKYLLFIILSLIFLPLAQALTVTSMDRIEIQSNSDKLAGEQWVLQITLDQLDDKIIGIFDAEDIKTDKGETATNDFKIDAEVNSRSCDYDIQRQDSIYRVEVVIMDANWNPFNDKSECEETPNAIYFWQFSDAFHGRCVVKKQLAHQGGILFPKRNFDATLKVFSDGDMAELNINSETNPDGDLMLEDEEKIGYANWIGNLVGGEDCPDALSQNVIAVQPIIGGWKTADKTNFDNYKSSIRIELRNCLDRIESKEQGADCVRRHNNKAESTLISKPLKNRQGDIATVSGDQIELILSKPIIFPTLRLRIKADWLGIFIPTGKPKIVSVDCKKFKEGSTVGEIKAVVKNTGSAEGSFSLSASCKDPFSFDETVITFNLDKGEQVTKTLAINVKEDIDKDVTAICIVNLKERNTGEADAKNTVCSAEPLTFCDAGETQCIAERFFECKKGQYVRNEAQDSECKEDEDGITPPRPPVIEECEDVFKIGTFTVIPDFGERSTTLAERIILGKDKTSCLGTLGGIAFGVAILIFILTLFFGGLTLKDALVKTNTFSKNRKLTGVGVLFVGIISLLVSFILYLLVLKLFVIGIIVGIIVIITLNVIKSRIPDFVKSGVSRIRKRKN